ncbi:MAG: cytochrome c family protein [Gammaproteobacteria bacterium]|nr:cytochrome c family protein [Gammaproteobacteria bacterium]
MKKIIITISTLIILLLGILFILNPTGIYELTDKTAKYIPLQEIPEGSISLKAKDCGVCHVEIYQEWQTSLHAKAFIDPFFTAYLKKDKGDPTCSVCHTPLENQSPIILTSDSGHYDDLITTPNPNYDPELQKEGVTCAACHVKDGVILGPYRKKELNAPHPVAYDEKFLKKSLCKQCHEVPSKDFSLMKEGICSTGMESNTGIWSARGYICQDCHMPAIKRPLMAGYPEREGRKHLWPGAYSKSQLQKVFTFKAEKNDNTISITITNSGAGHKAPTGDTDRFIILDFFWIDQLGEKTELTSIEFKRQVIWQPIMFVLSDNRLSPGESTQLNVAYPETAGALYVNGTYHVMTERSLNRLRDKYELKNEWEVNRPFIEQQKIDIHSTTN